MENTNDIIKQQMSSMAKLREKYPEAMDGFSKLLKFSDSEGALSAKTKELIALSIAIKSQCHWCIALHVKKLFNMGASKEEMLEAGMVAVIMGGGPSMMYMAELQKCIEELSQ